MRSDPRCGRLFHAANYGKILFSCDASVIIPVLYCVRKQKTEAYRPHKLKTKKEIIKMTVQTSKSILKVFGIIDIVLGVLVLLGSVLALMGGGLMASGAIPMDQVEAGVSGSLVLVAGGAMLVMGCFSLAEGILSRRAAKDPSKAQPAFVFAIISLVLAAINLTWAIVGGGSPVSAIVSVAINALLVMAANTQRKEGAAEALAA